MRSADWRFLVSGNGTVWPPPVRRSKVSRRTLFLWRAKLKAEGGNVAALVPGSTAPKRRRQRQWPAPIVAEIRRLRTVHPNLAKEKLHLLLWPFAAPRSCPVPVRAPSVA